MCNLSTIHTHICTHIKIKNKNKNQPPTRQNLKTKPPMSTLKVKALSPGQRYHSGQQHNEDGLCWMRGNFFLVTFLLLYCPLKKKSGIQVLLPRKKNQIQQTIFKRFSKAIKKKKKKKQLVAAGPESD